MSDLITNLNTIYNVKLQIKDVLGTSSDIFEDYPTYISALIAGGSGDGSFYSNDFTLTPLDGINNLIEFGDGTYAYGINKQIFTQETPTSAYFDLIPSSLNVSKDSNLNAYMMRDMSFVANSYSYNSVYNSGSGDVSAITSSNVPATDEFFTARTSFKFNFDKFASPTVRNGVTYTGPFYADGINSNVQPASDSSSIGNSFVEYVTTNDNEPNAIMRNSIESTVFGTYTIIPMKHDNTYQAVSQYNMTALNGPLKEYAQDSDGFTTGKVFGETLNHKIFDVVLSRTSYQAGFKDGKYDTVLVDIANYVGEVQMPRIGSGSYVNAAQNELYYNPFNDSYTYILPEISANGNLNYSNIMFNTSDGYKKVNLCEDMNGTTPNYLSPKIGVITHNQGEEDEWNTYIVSELGVLSNYCSVLGSRNPQYIIRNNNEFDITEGQMGIQIDAKTWKVSMGTITEYPAISFDESSNYYIGQEQAHIILQDTWSNYSSEFVATYWCAVAATVEPIDGGIETHFPTLEDAIDAEWYEYDQSFGFTVDEVVDEEYGQGTLPIIIFMVNVRKDGFASTVNTDSIFDTEPEDEGGDEGEDTCPDCGAQLEDGVCPDCGWPNNEGGE